MQDFEREHRKDKMDVEDKYNDGEYIIKKFAKNTRNI